MHIPDGVLNVGTVVSTAVVSAGGVANAVRIAGKRLGEKQVPLMGILAAFVFAAQLLNFPVPFAGVSGHFLGVALCAILLGPWAMVIIVFLVLLAQCLIFQDGGVFALGTNVFNMAIVGGMGSYLFYWLGLKVFGNKTRSKIFMAFIAAWLSVVLAAIACSLELVISGTAAFGIIMPAMFGSHAIIGIAEGVITVAALSMIRGVRKDLLEMEKI